MTLQDMDYDVLKTIFLNSIDGIYVADGKGNTLYVNAACERNYGVNADELIGKSVFDLEKQGIFVPSVVRMVLESGVKQTVIQRTKAGNTIIATGNPVFDQGGNIIKVICNSRDITELEKLRKELRNTKKRTPQIQSTSRSTPLIFPDHPGSEMYQVIQLAKKVAPADIPVLILGESGVGKDVLARMIHQLGSSPEAPFVHVNCAAIPVQLFESELFGYEAGAFSGARREGKKGWVEVADGGTLFLDEIGECPLEIQAKLLYVLEHYQVVRLGATRSIPVSFRLICATNQDLEQAVKERRFREDLYYRISGITLKVPPLRNRKEEIRKMADFFLQAVCKKMGINRRFSGEVLSSFEQCLWPGNIRQMKHLIEKLALLSENEEITGQDLARYAPELCFKEKRDEEQEAENWNLKQAIRVFERRLISRAIQRHGSTRKAARALGISHATLMRKMKNDQPTDK